MPAEVVIVDYGAGNVRSMENALVKAKGEGQRVLLTRDPEAIRGADRVVLPGVGAFAECRRKMDEAGVLEPLRDAVERGTPFLGVCVGMQVLADRGLEFGECAGLGWIPGTTRRIELTETGAGPRKLPHIGWSQLERAQHPLFEGIPEDAHFYFVHSYFLSCAEPSHVVAWVSYGERITAAVVRENVFGCQFHPEKSDRWGIQLLRNFCQWRP